MNDRLHETKIWNHDVTAKTNKTLSSRDKMRSYRERMRALGLRPIQIWVPDTRTAAFEGEAHRQSLSVAQSALTRQDQDFIDAATSMP